MAVPNIGVLASTTYKHYNKSGLADNIFKENALMNHLTNNGGVKKVGGGRSIAVPLMHSTNTTVSSFDGTDELDTTYQDGIDAAEFDWANYSVQIVISLTDKLKNNGKEQIYSLLKAKIKQAEMSIRERIADDLYNGDGTNTSLVGFDTAIGTGTYAGIAGATYSWWQATVDNTSEALSIADMRTSVTQANLGAGGKPVSIIATTPTLYDKYEALLTATLTMNVPASKEQLRLGDAGFMNLGYKGIPVVADENATSGSMYFLNVNNAKLYAHRDAFFKIIEAGKPGNQHVDISSMVFSGQLVVDRRASLAALENKTA